MKDTIQQGVGVPKRQVSIMIETTGLATGGDNIGDHRVIEIGVVELINEVPTGRQFHQFIDPEREISPGAESAHGICRRMLASKPKFHDIARDLLAFMAEAEVLTHKAAFHIAFLNHELLLSGRAPIDVERVVDIHLLAQQMFPDVPAKLQIYCGQLGISNCGPRASHSALMVAWAYGALRDRCRNTAWTDQIGDGKVLNFATARRILSGPSPYLSPCGDEYWLDLSRFKACEEGAFEYLMANIGALAGIDLECADLLPSAAKAIRRQRCAVFNLRSHSLNPVAANILGSWDYKWLPIRHLTLQTPLSVKAAAELVGGVTGKRDCDGPLHISVPSITPEVAEMLRQHKHELFIEIREQMVGADLVSALAGHAGYELTLTSQAGFSDEGLDRLESIPRKQVETKDRTKSFRIYEDIHAWFSALYGDDQYTISASSSDQVEGGE